MANNTSWLIQLMIEHHFKNRMQIILHIGIEKTGTSTIQECLLQNKKTLLSRGFCYLHMPNRNEYRDIAAFCLNPNRKDDYLIRKGVRSTEEREKFNRDFLKQFHHQISSIPSTAHTVILSSEHLSSRLMGITEVAKLQELISPYASSIKIICYLREQGSKVCSSYSTQVKTGSRLTFPQFLERYLKISRDNYAAMLDRWSNTFGCENLCVKIYSRDEFKNGDLLNDFFDEIDPSIPNLIERPRRQFNPSFSKRACQVMRRLNYLFPESIRGKQRIEAFRTTLINWLLKHFSGESIRLNDHQKMMIQKHFSESNQTVCDTFFPERSKLFKVD